MNQKRETLAFKKRFILVFKKRAILSRFQDPAKQNNNMNSESLIKALSSLPSDIFDFDEVSFEEEGGHHDDIESVDSLGSCCNSPNQSSDGSFSPTSQEHESLCDDADSDYFIFPSKTSSNSSQMTPNIKTEPDVKIKRKLECKVKRNERERRRVRRLADGFRKLREVVPGNYKKLSKLDTLKRALDYMGNLVDVLDTQTSSRFEQNFAGVPFIKQENSQYSGDYQQCSVPTYQNTISYQPVPDWVMYQDKQTHVQQATFTPSMHPLYNQRPPMMMSYNQHPC